MAAGPDIFTLLLAAAVVALIGFFFWHTGATMLKAARAFGAILDGRAGRQRAALDHEAIHGPVPLWLKAVRFLLIASLVALLAVWFSIKMAAA
ncbi:MAG: hypothetical protein WAT70_14350 [Rhizobiaceae bacterium]